MAHPLPPAPVASSPLLATFLEELDEHVRTLNSTLVALERAGGRGDGDELATLLRAAHSLKGAARIVDAQAVARHCHELEELLVEARETGGVVPAATFPTVFGIVDTLAHEGARLRASGGMEPPTAASTVVRPDSGARRATEPPPAALATTASVAVVRVGTERLDALLADSGELLVGWRRLEARSEALEAVHEQVSRWTAEWRGVDRQLRAVADGDAGTGLSRRASRLLADTGVRLERIERQLQQLRSGLGADGHALGQIATRIDEDVRRVRMQPFSDACAGMARAVRDLARTVDKQIALVIEGGDVELDRSIIEGIKDPLVQLVRNAVDHGVGRPDERRQAGKPPEGRITVSAAMRHGRVEIVIEDDGRGLDLDRLRAQAEAKGLSEPSDDRAAAALAFEPGLSTATAVTDLSGRGVGLDVVRSRILELGGSIDLASVAGRGTRFTLTLPLTLTTMRALFVTVGGETFALASTHVEAIVRLPAAGTGPRMAGREVLVRKDEIVPIVDLAAVLGTTNASDPDGDARPAVVVAAGELRVALRVDAIVAEHEVVVKTLGRRLQGLPWISGATLLTAGGVALVLNAAELVTGASVVQPTRSPASPLASNAAPKRILVVDDSLTTRSLERSILEAAGYEVAVAADGQSALQLLEERGADLIVSDVEMPRLDGLGLTEAVRASARWRGVPIVLVTGRESITDRTRGLELGADAYLVKSAFDQQVLLETVGQLL